jgi:hypothetical protein
MYRPVVDLDADGVTVHDPDDLPLDQVPMINAGPFSRRVVAGGFLRD